jgi:hypothetical protein
LVRIFDARSIDARLSAPALHGAPSNFAWARFLCGIASFFGNLDYSGGDTDGSTYMARFPEQHFTIICLSNMPLGDAEGETRAVLDLLHGWGKL